jgi:TPR repeat protein
MKRILCLSLTLLLLSAASPSAVLPARPSPAPPQKVWSEDDNIRFYDRYVHGLAQQGDTDAQVLAGLMYENGVYFKQDEARAVRWFRKAAMLGNPDAQYHFGRMYAHGRGVLQDYTVTAEWYRKAADQGQVEAEYGLGYLYENGLGVPQSSEQAAHWYRAAARRGHVAARSRLGMMYRSGDGVAKDYDEARYWLNAAAALGDAKATMVLGLMFEEGDGVDRNPPLAFEYMGRAAELGDTEAQNNLGWMYHSGSGTQSDPVRAYTWFSLAAATGDGNAADNRDNAARELNTEQIARGVAAARQLITEHAALSRPAREALPLRDSPLPAGYEEYEQVVSEPGKDVIYRVSRGSMVRTLDEILAHADAGDTARAPKDETRGAEDVRRNREKQVKSYLLSGQWTSDGKPATLLPSNLNICRDRGERVICLSLPQQVETSGGAVAYQVKTLLHDFSPDGTFQVEYLARVARLDQDAAQITRLLAAQDDSDWGISSHSTRCRLVSKTSVTCSSGESGEREYRRAW